MTCFLLMYLLSVVKAQRVPSCPVSCAVCSEDAVICQRLANIIDAADSTQALLLTEGSISVVQPASLSGLRNITVIGLSSNHISELSEKAFRNLPFLQTLLLDHNLLTGQALQGGALNNLTQLKVLALGHNHINMIEAGWFTGTKSLLSLKLEGNLVTVLNPGSFPLNDFRTLENLDLSDNLINVLDKNSFRGLVSLRNLDLSRNRLSSVPPEAFSYLVWLSNLNLDLNSWNCTCELLELAVVLSSFIQEPDKTLYNGRRMVCVSADNPAVTTVLELTEANCVPSNQNITVQIEARGSVSPQLYARDLAITAVFCFLGGVVLTLLVVLICYQVSQKKNNQKESQRLKEEQDIGATTANHDNQLDGRKKRREFLLQTNSSQQWNKEVLMLDERMNHHSDTFRSKVDANGQCPNCNTKMPNVMRKHKWVNGGYESENDQERRKLGMLVGEEKRKGPVQQQNYKWDMPNKVSSHNTNSSIHLLRETSDNLPSYKLESEIENYRTDDELKTRSFETSHCKNCERIYRLPEQNRTQRTARFNHEGTFTFNDRARREISRNMNTELKRDRRNVKFDLRSPSLEDEVTTPAGNEKSIDRTHKVQSNRALKVKLNLNPLKKSKVHPRKKNEQVPTKNSSSKRSKEKKKHGKGEEEEDEEKNKKTKKSSEKNKSSKTDMGKDKGEQKNSKSKSDKRSEVVQENNPDISQPPESTAVSAQNLQPLQYQTTGLELGGAQLAYQHPFSFSSFNRSNSTNNLSVLGSAGSQLTGSSLSLQAGNVLRNSMVSVSNPLLTGSLTNPIAPSVTFSGPNIAPSGSAESFTRPAAEEIGSLNPALLAKMIQASHLQAGGKLPAALLTSKSEDPVQSVAIQATPATLAQSQMQFDSSANVAALRFDKVQEIPTGQVQLQSTPESQADTIKEDLTEQGQDEISGDTTQGPALETLVENMSNVNNQPECGGQSEGPRVGGSLEYMKAAGISVIDTSVPCLPIDNEPSTAARETALLQQEYLSEEGSCSPRRKLRLVLPEKSSNRPPTALERKIR